MGPHSMVDLSLEDCDCKRQTYTVSADCAANSFLSQLGLIGSWCFSSCFARISFGLYLTFLHQLVWLETRL